MCVCDQQENCNHLTIGLLTCSHSFKPHFWVGLHFKLHSIKFGTCFPVQPCFMWFVLRTAGKAPSMAAGTLPPPPTGHKGQLGKQKRTKSFVVGPVLKTTSGF